MLTLTKAIVLVPFLFGIAVAKMKCPDSGARMHAGCEITSTFAHSCSDVQSEINARVSGQYSAWHDPHNNGTYTLKMQTAEEMQLERLTGDEKYTDKMIFTFTSQDAGATCIVEACSQSQVTSILDFSTNYCNLHNLYCAEEGCRPVELSLTYQEKIGECTQHEDDCTTV